MKYRANALNNMPKSQLVHIIMDLQKDIKDFEALLAAVQGYRLGINQLRVHIEKILKRTEDIEGVDVGIIL